MEDILSTVDVKNCTVCGSDKLTKVFDVEDSFSSKEVFPIVSCNVCGFRFTSSFPSEEVIGRYYDSADYISHSDSHEGVINNLYHFFRGLMLKRKVDVVKRFTTPGAVRLLDVGCATGYFLNEAAKVGWSVKGIEKNDHARQMAISQFGLDVRDEKYFFDIEKSSFNVITLWHVLEHLEKLNESLDKISEIIVPDGTVVIAVPNCDSYDAGFYRKFWAAYDVPRHLWHFSPSSLEKLLNKHGLKIVKRYAMPLDAFYISLLSEKYKGSSKPVQFLRALAVGSIGFLKSLTNLNHSSSIIYIAKRV